MIPQQGLANAIMAMGGTLFNQVMKVEPKGDYVFKSQLESLVGLLNRASYKLETIEDEVQDTELLLQVLFGGLGILGLLIGVLFYLVCRSSKELEAKLYHHVTVVYRCRTRVWPLVHRHCHHHNSVNRHHNLK